MSWVDGDGLERGGACNECGEPVEEEHHAYCADCYAEQQGWDRPPAPDRDALRRQHEERTELSHLRMLERIAELERRVAALEHPGGLYGCGGTVAA